MPRGRRGGVAGQPLILTRRRTERGEGGRRAVDKTAVLPSKVSPAYETWRTGNPRDVAPPTRAGVLLDGGGGSVDDAFRWLTDRGGGGDFLTLRTSGSDAYNPYVAGLAAPNSTETILFRSRKAAHDPKLVAKVRKAEVIFFAGGDQARHRAMWRDTPLMRAVNDAVARGVPVGGSSAGLAILGNPFYYSPDLEMVTSAEALADPRSPRIHLDEGMLALRDLRGVLTDTHFTQRDRMGRLIAFLARLAAEGHALPVRGIGVDERTSVAIDEHGIGTVLGAHHVYLLEVTQKPSVYETGRPLSIAGVRVRRLAPGDRFDVRNWTTNDGTPLTAAVEAGSLRLADPA